MILLSLKKVFASKIRISLYLILMFMTSILWWITTDVAVTIGNLGAEGKVVYVYLDILLSFIIILLFSLFLVSFLYRGYTLGNKASLQGKTGIGFAGGLVGTILSGCSCCGITLASTIGLLPLMILIPYEGLLGIKLLGLIALTYALYDTLTYIDSCTIKKKA